MLIIIDIKKQNITIIGVMIKMLVRIELRFGLQCLIDINGQKITLGLEPSIIYKANNPEDIWLFDINGYNQEVIYPMLIFKGSRQIWEAGKDEVYKTICNGQFGCYDGNFVNLKQDVEEKIREYIGELDTEIKRCEDKASECSIAEDIAKYIMRATTLTEVKNDLQGRLDEVI